MPIGLNVSRTEFALWLSFRIVPAISVACFSSGGRCVLFPGGPRTPMGGDFVGGRVVRGVISV